MSKTRVHFIGVCGTAMATLAAMLKQKGFDVRGSDLELERCGHAVGGAQRVVFRVLSVCVQIDEARGDDEPANVEHALARECSGRDALDHAAADADVAHGVEAALGIHHAAAAQNQLVAGRHGGRRGGVRSIAARDQTEQRDQAQRQIQQDQQSRQQARQGQSGQSDWLSIKQELGQQRVQSTKQALQNSGQEKFDEAFLSKLALLAYALTLVGMFALRGYMARNSIASIIVMLTVVGTLIALPNIGMYYGLHQWTAAHTGGFVDARVIAIIDTALESPLGQIAMIPMLAWIANSAPANLKACDLTSDPKHCDTYHAGDESYADNIWYWTTPIEDCIDGRTDVKCTDYGDWTQAWTEVKG